MGGRDRRVNVVLPARRQAELDEVADRIRAGSGVGARAVVVDLAQPSAMPTVEDATGDLEVGLLRYSAGADPNYQPFLANPVGAARSMAHRNCVVHMQMCHDCTTAATERGRGGLMGDGGDDPDVPLP